MKEVWHQTFRNEEIHLSPFKSSAAMGNIYTASRRSTVELGVRLDRSLFEGRGGDDSVGSELLAFEAPSFGWPPFNTQRRPGMPRMMETLSSGPFRRKG